ncbi:MAG: hypothetical protein O9327_01960 [Polaromonas sp.]|nr:hypothetical protein [Polaromonas sp.]
MHTNTTPSSLINLAVAAAPTDAVARLEAELTHAKELLQKVYGALDDASPHVDPGEGEAYAYQAVLVEAANYLGIDREAIQDRPHELVALVTVKGSPTDDDDADVPGVYALSVHLQRDIDTAKITPQEAGAIAQSVLDKFHEKIGIAELDDFEIEVKTENGIVLQEMDNEADHDPDLVIFSAYGGVVDESPVIELVQG